MPWTKRPCGTLRSLSPTCSLLPADLLARAQNTVTTAKRTLQDAQDSLAELLEPSDGSVAAAEAAVTRAKEELEDASIALDELLAGPDEDLLAQAMSDLDSARASLNEALVEPHSCGERLGRQAGDRS